MGKRAKIDQVKTEDQIKSDLKIYIEEMVSDISRWISWEDEEDEVAKDPKADETFVDDSFSYRTYSLLQTITEEYIKIKGRETGNDRLISEILFFSATRKIRAGARIDELVEILHSQVMELGTSEETTYIPCFSIRIKNSISSPYIDFGCLRIQTLSSAMRELAKNENNIDIIRSRMNYSTHFSKQFPARYPRYVMSAKGIETGDIAEEHIKKLYDVSIGYLEIRNLSGSKIIDSGSVDADPLNPHYVWASHVRVRDGQLRELDMSRIAEIFISNRDYRMITSEEFQSKVIQLQMPKGRGFVSRMSNALSWYSRAKQSADRAQRTLFLFTALEALIGSKDKYAPVIQTVARRAACILSGKHELRSALFAEIKDLYGYRSGLVHQGSNEINWMHVGKLEIYVTNILSIVFDKFPIGTGEDIFLEELDALSFGKLWVHPDEEGEVEIMSLLERKL